MYGFAVPIVGGVADHTWVWAEDGFCCACPDTYARGCDEGDRSRGRIVCRGDGDTDKARMMAGSVDSFCAIPVQCGLTYAMNGVCQQMSNRILLATGRRSVDVWEASGALTSYSNFGIWGTTVSPAAIVINPILALILSVQTLSEFDARCRACGIPNPLGGMLEGRSEPMDIVGPYDNPTAPLEGSEPMEIEMGGPTRFARRRAPVKRTAGPEPMRLPTPVELGISEREQIERAEANYEATKQQLGGLYRGLDDRADEGRLEQVKEIFEAYHQPSADRILGAGDLAGSDLANATLPPPEVLALQIAAANTLAQAPVIEAANFLKEPEFQRVFGHSRDENPVLIEPEILLRAAAQANAG